MVAAERSRAEQREGEIGWGYAQVWVDMLLGLE